MRSSTKLLLVVSVLLLLLDIKTLAQDPIDQYPGIPLVIYPNRRVQDMIDTHPNSLDQIKQMGVYGTLASDLFDDPDYLDEFTTKGIKVLPSYTWGTTANLQDVIWRYTNSHYTVWEAEGTDPTKGLAKLYHNINTAQFTEGSTKGIWTNNTTIPAGTELINGPGYPQNVTYNYSDQIVDYTAEYRMKINRRLPSTLPQNYQNNIVCKIIVTNKKDGGYPEEEVESYEVKVSDFSGWNNWNTISLNYDLRNYKNTTQPMGDKGLRLPRGSAYFVQFKVIWYGLEYLNLYIDRIRVSDEKGRELVERLLARSQISTLVNTNINESTIVGWYGTDEPGSIDNYEPYRLVDSIIYAVSVQHNKPLRLHAAITGSWRGTFAYSDWNYGMAHNLYVADEFWLRAKPKNIPVKLLNSNFLITSKK